MRKTLSLVLPVLIPSWQFFRTVEPSPRVQWAQLQGETSPSWQEFRPRPRRLSPTTMLGRLFYNAPWNEALFLVSCAERIEAAPTAHSINQIQRRILASLAGTLPSATLQFRLIFVHRSGREIVEDIIYHSAPFTLPPSTAP